MPGGPLASLMNRTAFHPNLVEIRSQCYHIRSAGCAQLCPVHDPLAKPGGPIIPSESDRQLANG